MFEHFILLCSSKHGKSEFMKMQKRDIHWHVSIM